MSITRTLVIGALTAIGCQHAADERTTTTTPSPGAVAYDSHATPPPPPPPESPPPHPVPYANPMPNPSTNPNVDPACIQAALTGKAAKPECDVNGTLGTKPPVDDTKIEAQTAPDR